jgi:hypothetical protein
MLAPPSTALARRPLSEADRAFEPHHAPRWFHAHEARGVAVLVHGLDMQPATLDGFAGELAAGGLSTYRIALDGHGAPFRCFARTDPAWWLDDTLAALAEASRVARRAGVPLVAVGSRGVRSVPIAANATSRSASSHPSPASRPQHHPTHRPNPRNRSVLTEAFTERFASATTALR